MDGMFFVNEFVMCLYNMGYWIIDGVIMSQFEQYVCVVLDFLFGDFLLIDIWLVMVNVFGGLVGEDMVMWYFVVFGVFFRVKFYFYGKQLCLGCKVGYVIVGGVDFDEMCVVVCVVVEYFLVQLMLLDGFVFVDLWW